jgi:formylmethanofuran dehydrogenase subunit C
VSLEFTQHTLPSVPLEAESLSVASLAGLTAAAAAKLPVVHGNRAAEIGDFFDVAGTPDGEVHISGDLSRVKQVGADMAAGRLVVHGGVGMHLGTRMTGGEIVVEGDAGDWVGSDMRGGRIIVRGDAGHLAGSTVRGEPVGMRGGEILVFGSAGNEVGSGMRRGLVAIGGDAGDFTGVNMLAGTIVVLGRMGTRPGAGMKRGTIIAMHPAEMLPTFSYACRYRPVFVRLYLAHLRALGMPITEAHMNGPYRRWCGDAIELNRGEVLVLDDGTPAASAG